MFEFQLNSGSQCFADAETYPFLFSVALLIGSLSHAGLAKKKHPISPSAPNSTLIQRIFADGMPSVCRRPILLLNMHFCDR